jgi:hypothetical protein
LGSWDQRIIWAQKIKASLDNILHLKNKLIN